MDNPINDPDLVESMHAALVFTDWTKKFEEKA